MLKPKSVVCMTQHTGTIKIEVKEDGKYSLGCYMEDCDDNVPDEEENNTPEELNRKDNPTNWHELLTEKLDA